MSRFAGFWNRIVTDSGTKHRYIQPHPYKELAHYEQLQNYLRWRFQVNNHSKYMKYCQQWINALQAPQLMYFAKEKQHLIDNGIYK